jgi:hypothetical protein
MASIKSIAGIAIAKTAVGGQVAVGLSALAVGLSIVVVDRTISFGINTIAKQLVAAEKFGKKLKNS